MKRVLYVLVTTLTVAYLIGAYLFSSEITTYKVKTYDEVLQLDQLKGYQDAGLPAPEDTRTPSGDIVVAAWIFRNPKNRRCGIVMHHGRGSNRAGNLKYSKLFWPRGCHLLMYDARHHGDTTGVFSTWGVREKQDLANMV